MVEQEQPVYEIQVAESATKLLCSSQDKQKQKESDKTVLARMQLYLFP